MHLVDLILLILIALAVGLAIAGLARGKSSCCGDCSKCSGCSGRCGKAEDENYVNHSDV